MSRKVHCIGCDITYAPSEARGALYCTNCGATVYPVLIEADSETEFPTPGVLVETPPVPVTPVEQVIVPPVLVEEKVESPKKDTKPA